MSTITKTMDIYDFEPWSGAVDTYERIEREGKLAELDDVLDEIYPDGIDETELNDLLWFEPETVYEWLGMRTESEIREEISDVEEERETAQSDIDMMMTDYTEEAENLTEEEARELWESTYADDIADLKNTVDELDERISELKEELENL